ncbi:MAG: RIP metalloprotease RseP, partial [Pseudohongiellaceae bacterium]
AVIGQVVANSPAQKAGLQVGDKVLETDETIIENWAQWREIVRASPGRMLSMRVDRNGEILNLELTPEETIESGEIYGLAGVAPEQPIWPEELLRERDYGFFGALQAGTEKTWSTSLFIFDSLKKLITGQVSTKSLGGPVSIAKFAGASAEAGWQSFLAFLGIMSVMLGIMNLLPIPVLDGGHLLFYIIEAVKGSPLNDAIQAAAMRLGVSIVFGIMLLALYNDFMRL